MKSLSETIGPKLRELRKASGLTASQAGAQVGKSGQTIYAYEAGRTQPDAAMFLTLLNLYQARSISVFFPDHDAPEFLQDRFSALSETGQRKVISYVDDLAAGEKYRSLEESDSPDTQ
ncbi:MAG: helix-turn-helix domain-containing protein [Raoultibacter sp.]|jgi:transcriptional regulator with XRE-family HTH domain